MVVIAIVLGWVYLIAQTKSNFYQTSYIWMGEGVETLRNIILI